MERDAPLPEHRYGYPDDVNTPEELAGFIDELWAKSKGLTSKSVELLNICSSLEHAEENVRKNLTLNDSETATLRVYLDAWAPKASARLTDEHLEEAMRSLWPPDPEPSIAPRPKKKPPPISIFWPAASMLAFRAGHEKDGQPHSAEGLRVRWGKSRQ